MLEERVRKGRDGWPCAKTSRSRFYVGDQKLCWQSFYIMADSPVSSPSSNSTPTFGTDHSRRDLRVRGQQGATRCAEARWLDLRPVSAAPFSLISPFHAAIPFFLHSNTLHHSFPQSGYHRRWLRRRQVRQLLSGPHLRDFLPPDTPSSIYLSFHFTILHFDLTLVIGNSPQLGLAWSNSAANLVFFHDA